MPVESLTPVELKARLDAGESLVLIDVREEREWAIARIEGAVLKPMTRIQEWQDEIAPDGGPYVFVCHHGIRSQRVAEYLASRGVKDLINLAGGIDGWSQTVDAGVPRY